MEYNYVHSHISGTQSVKTTPFCAGTQAPSVDSPLSNYTSHMLNPLTDCRYNDDEEEECENTCNTWFSEISQYGVQVTLKVKRD